MNKLGKFLTLVSTLAFLALPFLVWWKAQALTDWWQLHNYTPPTAIASLASQGTMNAYTKHMFYLNHPQLVSDVSAFRQDCPVAPKTIVLGCYHPDQDGIYIYAVSDPQLAGIQQVTAAHEVLHAVYGRLSEHDRNQLDAELNNYYENGLKDQRVIDEVNLYKQTEPNDVMDEMSCTFGTEIADLPPALDAYYNRFFNNRQTIVNFEQAYESQFDSRESQASAYSAQLSKLKDQINTEEQSLQTQLDRINSDRATLDSERSGGQVDAYNSGVASFNSEVDSYNSGVSRLKSDIASYNGLVSQYNAVAKELAGLEQAIDTRLTTQTAQ